MQTINEHSPTLNVSLNYIILPMRWNVAFSISVIAAVGFVPSLNAQTCPSTCTTLTSGPLTFCRCLIYTGGSSDRIQLVTDRSVTIVDVDGDGLRDIPFGVWYLGSQGAYILKQTSPGIPGTFTAYRISPEPAYGITNIGDVNGDGIEDFASAGHWENHSVYMILSDGTFPSYHDTLLRYHEGSANNPNSIIGYGGMIFWSAYDGSVSFYDVSTNTLVVRNDSLCGDGIAFGDFNNDGYVDAACSRHGWATANHGLYIYYFNGSSFYAVDTVDRTGRWQGILSYDINGDGLLDIVGVSHWGSVWLNRGGYFEEIRIDSNLSAGISSSDQNPFARVNIADLDCDGDMDIVAATACPPSGEAMLKWYEQVDTTTWVVHPIDFSGYNCSAPYPYGVRVGLLDEITDTGRADIVIVKDGRNRIYAYYNVSDVGACQPLSYDDGTEILEAYTSVGWSVNPTTGGITLISSRPLKVGIFNAAGKLVRKVEVSGTRFVPLPAGVFFIKADGKVKKVIVR